MSLSEPSILCDILKPYIMSLFCQIDVLNLGSSLGGGGGGGGRGRRGLGGVGRVGGGGGWGILGGGDRYL